MLVPLVKSGSRACLPQKLLKRHRIRSSFTKSSAKFDPTMLHRAMTRNLTYEDAQACVAWWHSLISGKPIECPALEAEKVELPIQSNSTAGTVSTELFACTLSRVVANYDWSILEAPLPESLSGLQLLESLVTLPGESSSDRFVLACSTPKGFDVLPQVEREGCSVHPILGALLVQRLISMAANEEPHGINITGLSLDPSPERFTVLHEPQILQMLGFFAESVLAENALARVDAQVQRMAYQLQSGEASTREAQVHLATDLHQAFKQPLYWALATLQGDGAVIVGTQSPEGNFSFIFTAPDLALRHYLDAKVGNLSVPKMVVVPIPREKLVTMLSKESETSYDACWFNAPGRIGSEGEMQGYKLNSAFLLRAFETVDKMTSSLAKADVL